jgi:asparagine synthase (glutamine-hydrolysing)
MNAALAHRGPDDKGTVVLDRIGLAMSRLSVIDLTTGHQPLSNQEQTCWIVYNGEVYNFLELHRELEEKGYQFRTHSDTEVILRAYEAWGPDCVRRLRGMFAFAIADDRESFTHLFLARDRVGKKPLYYYHDADWFIFGSEIKALLSHPAVPRHVNHRAVPLYLVHGYVPAPETMFEEIYELPPGHYLLLQNGKIHIQEYWDPPHEPESDFAGLREAEVSRQVRSRLEEAVRIRLVSDVPLGAFLSGGLDSTAIVALMSQLSGNSVKTFAIGFEGEPSFNELEHARAAAKVYGTDHHEFVVRPDTVDLLPKLVWHYDQPFGDSSGLPTYLVSKLTREHVTVALTGDGGDELFAGYDRIAAADLAQSYRRLPRIFRSALIGLLRSFPESTGYGGVIRRARRFVEYASLPLTEQYLAWAGVFDRGFLHQLLMAETIRDPLESLHTAFDRVKGVDPLSRLLYVNMKTFLPGDLLVKTDRMSMAHSLEARCPFLDHELIEFVGKIPSALKLKGLTTKYILKKAMEGLVPSQIVHRKKHGFGAPVGQWFRTSLREYVRETLLSPGALRRGYFREEVVRDLIDEHQCGKRDHGQRLWVLLTLEIWHQIFIDRSPALEPVTLIHTI